MSSSRSEYDSFGVIEVPRDALGAARVVHPNDDVNLGQSSNDLFPTAMHVAVVLQSRPLFFALERLRARKMLGPARSE